MKNVLNHYYRFIKTTGATRHDCNASTGDYEYFETRLINKIKYNVGGLSINLGSVPECFNNNRHRATLAISRGSNISKLFLFDINEPYVFYGDAQGTNDALLIIVKENIIEIFIAKDYKNKQIDVCSEFENGSLADEIEALKDRVSQKELPKF
jgi:hypothetical protein